MITALQKYIERYTTLSPSEYAILESSLTLTETPKKQFLLKAGQICKARYFIIEGCYRLYYFDENGNEQIIHFGIENWWISEYDSLINQSPSNIYIQAVENSSCLILKEEVLEELYTKIPKLERFFRIIMEKTYIASQRRTEYMLSLSKEKQYHQFVSHNPTFLQRIPQYMLASYLGITPEFLSKLRAKYH